MGGVSDGSQAGITIFGTGKPFHIRPQSERCISKYPPAEPGALLCEPLEAAIGVANAAPVELSHLAVAGHFQRFIWSIL